MTDTHLIDERLRRFLAADDDSDWQDVLRRARPRRTRSLMLGRVTGIPPLAPSWSRQVARRRRLVGLSAAASAIAVTGVVVGLLVTAASPPSAYAAAKQALAATAAVSSGTMTLSTGASVRWSGKDLAIASGAGGNVLPGFDQLLLVGGAVYLRRADGSWLHYASEADLAPLLDRGTVLAAYGLAVASRAAQIIASAYGLQTTEQPDGSTVYSGTVPPETAVKVAPGKGGGPIMGIAGMLLPSFGSGGALKLVVGSDGLVRQMSETAAPPLTGAWRIDYTRLGDAPPITLPGTYTEGTAADLP
jgi:hypothetical protein